MSQSNGAFDVAGSVEASDPAAGDALVSQSNDTFGARSVGAPGTGGGAAPVSQSNDGAEGDAGGGFAGDTEAASGPGTGPGVSRGTFGSGVFGSTGALDGATAAAGTGTAGATAGVAAGSWGTTKRCAQAGHAIALPGVARARLIGRAHPPQ